MSYQPTIPTGSVPLNQDYLNVQGNFSSLDTQWAVDHVPLTTAPGPSIGFHKAIHLVPQAPPTAVNGYGELYVQTLNDGSSTGQQVWYQFINGSSVTVNYPLTRNFQPVSSSTSGYSFLPGGLIIQWGTASVGVLTNFPIPFQGGTTPVLTYGFFNRTTVPIIGTLSNTQFTISGSGTTVTWMAIGQ